MRNASSFFRYTALIFLSLVTCHLALASTAFAAKDEKAVETKPAAAVKAAPADFSQVEKLAGTNSDLAVEIYRIAAQWCLNRNQAAQAAAFYEEALAAAPGQARLLEELAEAQLAAGKSYFRKAGVEHDVLNETASEIVFLEVELKP